MEENKNGSMKILGLKVDGLRKLKAVNLTFNENGLLVIKGDNETGKTTLWDSIKWLVQGNKHLNQDIIQHGKEKAVGELSIGDYVIKRTATKKSNTLEVKNIKTNLFEKGEVQRFLDSFVNALTFNPRPFAQKTSLEKYQFCLELFKEQLEKLSKEILGYGFTGIDTKLVSLEEERLLVGREIKKFGDLDIDMPEKVLRVDVQELLNKKKAIEDRNSILRQKAEDEKQKQLEDINEFNRTQRERAKALEVEQDRYADLESDKVHILGEIEETGNKIKELQTKLLILAEDEKIVETNLIDSKNKLAELPEPLPEKPLSTLIKTPEYEDSTLEERQIQQALLTNKKAELYEKYLDKVNEKLAKQSNYDALDDIIKNLRLQKLEILRKVNTGVDGLEIREDGIYHKDIYADNWSDAEGLEIACELANANMPPLRAIFIDGGEALGKAARERLEKFAKEKDLLIGVSIVADELTEEDKNSDNVFFIEDGTIQEKTL